MHLTYFFRRSFPYQLKGRMLSLRLVLIPEFQENSTERQVYEDRPMVLNRGDFIPQEDIHQHLKTILTSVTTTKVGERLGDAADI